MTQEESVRLALKAKDLFKHAIELEEITTSMSRLLDFYDDTKLKELGKPKWPKWDGADEADLCLVRVKIKEIALDLLQEAVDALKDKQ